MALTFPTSPSANQIYTDTVTGNRYTWNSTKSVWQFTSNTIGLFVASTAPANTQQGSLWWNRDYGRLMVYYNDGDSSQWVDASPFDATSALAYNTANAAYTLANNAYTAAYYNVVLKPAWDVANASYNTANAAFDKANSSFQNTSGTLNGSLTVKGNVDFSLSTASLILPNGTTAQQPAGTSPSGQIRFNSSTNRVERSLLGFWFDDNIKYTNIINKSRVVFQYTGGAQTWTIPNGVSYVFVKMWGAGGGGGSYGGWRQGSTGGAGGYSEGILPVVAGQTMTIRVGQQGYPRWGANKAYPDGGGASTAGGDNQYAGAGGGSTSIQVPNINSGTWCMFAGGGGGGGCVNGWARNPGGAGGGTYGEDAYCDGGQSYTPFGIVGKGGTQSAGGAGGAGSNTTGGAGSYNTGGTHQNGNCYGGGGGGGYYGGGSGAYGASMGGGGGGSGFIHSSIIRGLSLTGNREYPPFANDMDLIAYSLGTSYRLAFGGDEAIMGGPGLVVIYY